jgi:four helix bundle protein
VGYSYRDLIVWQKAKKFVIEIYRATEPFPQSELYGLTCQLRRAAVSVASNIAEGQGRATPGEFVNFLSNARGSLLEIATQLEISRDLGFLRDTRYSEMDSELRDVLGLLNLLIVSLNRKRGVRADTSKP